MNEAKFKQWLEAGWRGPLPADQQRDLDGYLAAHPHLREEWESGSRLTSTLRALPDIPVPSNFMALVESGIKAKSAPTRVARAVSLWRWLPVSPWLRAGAGLAALALALLGVREYQVRSRLQMARSVAAVSTIAAVPKIEWLENFDAIHEMAKASEVDEELVSLLR